MITWNTNILARLYDIESLNLFIFFYFKCLKKKSLDFQHAQPLMPHLPLPLSPYLCLNPSFPSLLPTCLFHVGCSYNERIIPFGQIFICWCHVSKAFFVVGLPFAPQIDARKRISAICQWFHMSWVKRVTSDMLVINKKS